MRRHRLHRPLTPRIEKILTIRPAHGLHRPQIAVLCGCVDGCVGSVSVVLCEVLMHTVSYKFFSTISAGSFVLAGPQPAVWCNRPSRPRSQRVGAHIGRSRASVRGRPPSALRPAGKTVASQPRALLPPRLGSSVAPATRARGRAASWPFLEAPSRSLC